MKKKNFWLSSPAFNLKINSPKPSFPINEFGSKPTLIPIQKDSEINSSFWDNDELTYTNFEKTKLLITILF